MSILSLLSSSLGRRDEEPNQALAAEVAQRNDKVAVKELVDNLGNKKKDIRNNCIKVLYEIGITAPHLIEPYTDIFAGLLAHKDNRMIWGAMHALDMVNRTFPESVVRHLARIIDAADSGSVITRDHAINILISLSKIKKHHETALTLLLEQMKRSPSNQVPMYAEDLLPAITPVFKKQFAEALGSKLPDLEKDSKRKRVEKVIRKLQ